MMWWTIIDTWIVLDVLIVAISAALVGTHLVLRKDSMLGDGISHAVLPGIAIGYLLTQSRESGVMYIGAIVMGVLTALLSEFISRSRKIDAGASLGTVFSGFFAVGLVLVNMVANDVDLDPSCVLFGAVELTPLDTMELAGFTVPRAIVTNGVWLIVNAIVLLVIYRQLTVSVFDALFAQASGIRVQFIRYLHVVLIAITTVTAFETVGSILIVAFLVIPQSIALFISKSVRAVILWSIVCTAVAGILGHIVAVTVPPMFGFVDTNTIGSITLVLGVLLGLMVMFSPKGIVSRQLNIFYNQILIAKDDFLKSVYQSERKKISLVEIKKVISMSIITKRFSTLSVIVAKWHLILTKKIVYKDKHYMCTDIGRKIAEALQLKHWMWEDYLYSQADVESKKVHFQAEKLEHIQAHNINEDLRKSVKTPTVIPGHTHTLNPLE